MSQIPRLHPGTRTDASAPPAATGAPRPDPRPDPWADDDDNWPAHRAHPDEVHDQSPLRSLGEAVSDVVRSTAAAHPMEQVLNRAGKTDSSDQTGHHDAAGTTPQAAKPRP